MEINEALARKVLQVVDAGLVTGMGKPIPGQMCVEAAVNFAMDLPHGDEPSCVSSALRRLKIRLNDSAWSSDKARAAGLRRLAVIQLGSAGVLDDREFATRVTILVIRKYLPPVLRRRGHEAEAIACEAVTTLEEARKAATEARKVTAYAAYADYAAAYAADYAAAAAAAAAAAYAAYDDYAADYAAAYAADARDNKSLAAFAEDVVQILVEMKVPGAAFLPLTEAA